MAKHAIARTDQLTPEQFADIHRKYIGGSMASTAIGLNPYKSQLQLWLELTGKVLAAPVNSDAVYFGTLFEPLLRAEFQRRTGLKTEAVNLIIQSIERPWQIASPDGIVREADGTTSLLEIKTTSAFNSDWSDGVSTNAYCQVQHYLSVLELQKAYLCVLKGGQAFEWTEIPRDEDMIAIINELERQFMECVISDTPPQVDDKSADALAAMYPQSQNTTAILHNEADNIIAEYLKLKKAEEDIKAQRTLCENQLKNMLGVNESAKSPAGYFVSWKSSTSSKLDTTKLKEEHADLIAQYTSQTSFRRFSITAPKAKKA